MLQFWRNPEFIRHVRAELRPARLASAVVITYVVIGLIAMAMFGQNDPRSSLLVRDNLRIFYEIIGWTASVLLVLWCLSVGSQAVAGERELKTFDFLRTTRLRAAELLLGKLLGGPVLAYVIYGCALLVIIPAGFAAGYDLPGLLLTYTLVLCLGLLVGLVGIWLSMLFEKINRGLGVLALFLLYPFAAIGLATGQSAILPGLGCLSPMAAIAWAHGIRRWPWASWNAAPMSGTVPVFGVQVPYAVITLALYASIGAWLVLMIVRNLKRDMEEIRLLSRWQAIGFGFYINILFYAFLDLREVLRSPANAMIILWMGLVLTGVTTAIVGLATLSSPERLKVWTRRRSLGEEGYLSEDGLPWPWMIVTAAMGFGMLAVQVLAVSGNGREFNLAYAAVAALHLLVFAMREILFLQWCKLTRMKSPVTKGVLLLILYYFAASMAIVVASSVSQKEGLFAARVLTPMFYFEKADLSAAAAGMLTGVAVQGAVIAVLLGAIGGRLQRTLALARA